MKNRLESTKCPFCDLNSKNLDELKLHIGSIHIRNGDQENTQDGIINQETELCFKCSECDFSGNKSELDEHFKTEHVTTTTIEPFPC